MKCSSFNCISVEFIELHTGLDKQAKYGYSIQVLIYEAAKASVTVSIAGEVNLNSIAGGAIYGAEDTAVAAKALKEMLMSAN